MMKQGTCKGASKFTFSWPSVQSLPLRSVYFLSDTPLEMTQPSISSGYRLERAFGLGMGHMTTSFRPSVALCADSCRPCACCFILSQFVCSLVSLFKSSFFFFFWFPPSPLTLRLFFSSSSS